METYIKTYVVPILGILRAFKQQRITEKTGGFKNDKSNARQVKYFIYD